MSGIFKAVGKVFKPIKKAVTSIAKGVKNVAKKVWESKIGRMVVIAAAVWFTYGAVTAYAAAPANGIGAAMSQSAGNMWTTVSTLGSTGGAAGASGATGAVGAGAPVSASTTGMMGTGAINVAPGTTALAAKAGMTAAGATLPAAAAPAAGGGGIISGVGGFMKANPLATLMIGQGVSNAAQGMFAKDIANKRQDYLERVRTSRGLYGRDYNSGSGPELPTGETGILAPYMKPLAAPAAPSVQATAAPTTGTTQVPVADLANLKKQGLIAGSA